MHVCAFKPQLFILLLCLCVLCAHMSCLGATHGGQGTTMSSKVLSHYIVAVQGPLSFVQSLLSHHVFPLLLFLWDRFSHCSPGWLGTPTILLSSLWSSSMTGVSPCPWLPTIFCYSNTQPMSFLPADSHSSIAPPSHSQLTNTKLTELTLDLVSVSSPS